MRVVCCVGLLCACGCVVVVVGVLCYVRVGCVLFVDSVPVLVFVVVGIVLCCCVCLVWVGVAWSGVVWFVCIAL